MGYFLAIPILALVAALQVSFFPKLLTLISPLDFGTIPIINLPLSIELYNGQLSLILILVLAWSIHAEIEEAVFWAFMGGIFQDVLNPIIPTGSSVIAFLLMVFVIKALEHNFYRLSAILLLGAIPVGTIVQHLVVFVVLTLQNYNLNFSDVLQKFTLPTLGINLVACLPVYFLIRIIQPRLPRRQSPWAVAQISVSDS